MCLLQFLILISGSAPYYQEEPLYPPTRTITSGELKMIGLPLFQSFHFKLSQDCAGHQTPARIWINRDVSMWGDHGLWPAHNRGCGPARAGGAHQVLLQQSLLHQSIIDDDILGWLTGKRAITEWQTSQGREERWSCCIIFFALQSL